MWHSAKVFELVYGGHQSFKHPVISTAAHEQVAVCVVRLDCVDVVYFFTRFQFPPEYGFCLNGVLSAPSVLRIRRANHNVTGVVDECVVFRSAIVRRLTFDKLRTGTGGTPG
jgi:hypothetical protein